MTKIKYKILITGGAGFIGSNLIDHFLQLGHKVVCLDNLSTGFEHNIEHHYDNNNFTFINGDIRDLESCKQAVKGCDYVSHQAALGSVPRSINDPITTNEVNISGFLNMLIASRNEGVKRFVYAASSSTYGDSKKLPKVEHEIGKPLSPYAITKYVNELYADIFAKIHGMQCIGLRYFNVFGKRQDPNGAYAAVIPLWVKQLINHESPLINGDGDYSRDFTYIDNVVQANENSLFTSKDRFIKGQVKYYGEKNHIMLNDKPVFSEVFNIAFGSQLNLKTLFSNLKNNLKHYDSNISLIEPNYGPCREGDIPHSVATIKKANTIIDYRPIYDAKKGFEMAVEWYFENLKQ
jgi:UDP-N-acetylglucosamine/UDP-N-acetylgalactosamine 4-epimerase